MEIRKEKQRKREYEAKQKAHNAEMKKWTGEIKEWAEKTGAKYEDRDAVGKKIQNALYDYLKKLANSQELSEYKPQMKKALKIVKSEYSNYGIQITDYQDGLPYNDIDKYQKEHPEIKDYKDLPKELIDNSWYYTMLDKGEKFVRDKFKYELSFYGFEIGTGDGDEGNIYID